MSKRAGIFSRLNQRIIAALDRRAGRTRLRRVSVSPQALTLEYADESQHHLTWDDLRRVVAIRRDVFAGDLLCVLMELSTGGVVEVPATVAGWDDLCTALDQLPRARPTVQWSTEVLSQPTGTPVDILLR